MNTRIYHIDAFTDKPFAGNPAAVCMVKVAIEGERVKISGRAVTVMTGELT